MISVKQTLTFTLRNVAVCYKNVHVNDLKVDGAAGVTQLVFLILLVLMRVLV